MTLYLLDSDHLSLHQRGHEPIRMNLLEIPPERICISVISVEELLRGRLAQVHRGREPGDRVQNIIGCLKHLIFYVVLRF
jgi:tRNA(fMet)-specific endonuclease VapC